MGDRIELRRLRLLGAHGVLPEERARRQPFEVDLDVGLDLSAAAASDELADTVDYGGLVEHVRRVVEEGSYRLLEALAGAIAEALLAEARVEEVTVAVRKLRPPLAADIASTGVRLTRRQVSPGGA